MKKGHSSPVTSLLVSLTLTGGILVAGLTNGRVVPGARAQVNSGGATTLMAHNGTLAGGLINARGVIVNGVAINGVFAGRLGIDNSLLESACGISGSGDGVYILGAYPSGNAADGPSGTNGAYPSGNAASDAPSTNGAYPSGNLSDAPTGPNGAYPSGNSPSDAPSINGAYPSGNIYGAYPSGNTYVGSGLEVFGGVLEGDQIRVANGVITGRNLRVVGAYVTAACSR